MIKECKIIPAILEKDFFSIRQKINLLNSETKDFQIDVADRTLTKSSSFLNGEKLIEFSQNLNLEVHLMVKNPHQAYKRWLNGGTKKIIFHLESFWDLKKTARTSAVNNFINLLKKEKLKIGIGLLYETSVRFIDSFVDKIDSVLLLAIKEPGFQGKAFELGIYDKITYLKAKHPNLVIEVDGGINEQNILKLKEAGATIFSVGSFIWQGEARENFMRLQELVNG